MDNNSRRLDKIGQRVGINRLVDNDQTYAQRLLDFKLNGIKLDYGGDHEFVIQMAEPSFMEQLKDLDDK